MDLAVSASTGVLKAVLPELAKLLTDEYMLQSSVKEGIRYLQKELGSMQGALEKVSHVPAKQLDSQDKNWASNLRDMSYDIQDTIDSYMVHVDPDDESASSTTCCVNVKGILPQTCMARRDIATAIERIKKEVQELSGRRERYKFDGMAVPAPPPPDHRLEALYKDKEKLVGIDRPRERIIELLSMGGEATSEQKLKLVSIVGPGGMGKTTLANAAYQKLQGKFDCTAFVSVSLQPNMKNILSIILRQVTRNIKDDPDDKDEDKDKDKNKNMDKKMNKDKHNSQKHYGNTETWSEKEVIDEIRLVLEKRRYLIFIDDIWDEEPWELLSKCVLVENKLGSKVIMTTRKLDVARSCCCSDLVDGIVHELQPLSDGDSKQLFYCKIFGNDGCPTELEVVSQKILDKCEGWPIGIIAIASLLKNKPAQTEDQRFPQTNKETEDQWWSVYDSISRDGVKDMRLILSLSYRDMPSQLRACLLYLSIFPEDHIIGRDDLIRRWTAENLVDGYELGDKYFNELINRCMIQPSDVDAFGRAQACKIHDLVLDFVTSLSTEEGFLSILNDKQQHSPPPSESIHRLSLRNSKEEHGIPQATKRLPHVRTLVVSSRAINSMPSLAVFPVVRVLELEECTTRKIKRVGNLFHLRYLRLSQDYYYGRCIKLPKGIGNLRLLQTLDLKEAIIKELPSTVVQLRQVRVLEISLRKWNKRCEKRLLQCLCNLKQLEVLCIFAPGLSMLQIDWAPSHLQRFTACPRHHTQHIFRRGSVWIELSPFSTLPRWINSSLCSRLSDLSLMVQKLRQADLKILADFPILRSLDLEVVEVKDQATGKRLEIDGCVGTSTGHATSFQCLGNLKFASRAVGLVFRRGAMLKLQKLYLSFDVAQTKDVHRDFDLGLENLPSLESVQVEMDCRCARLHEVDAAEAALHNATSLNPNCPTLDLKRYFEGEMLRDKEEEIPEELRGKKMEDALLSRVGPFGGKGGRARYITVAPHRLEKVTIRSGNCVDSLAFSYTDQNGQQRTEGPWGGGGGKVSTIILGPSEYLIKVSGTIGSFYEVANCVTSLTFVTNTASYGPFGKGGGVRFDALPVHSNSSIVGFFGRAGGSLDAIGFYVRPL